MDYIVVARGGQRTQMYAGLDTDTLEHLTRMIDSMIDRGFGQVMPGHFVDLVKITGSVLHGRYRLTADLLDIPVCEFVVCTRSRDAKKAWLRINPPDTTPPPVPYVSLSPAMLNDGTVTAETVNLLGQLGLAFLQYKY